MKTLQIKVNERAVLFQGSLPKRALAPGRYRFWSSHLTEQRWATDKLVFATYPQVREVLPQDWYRSVELSGKQRALLYLDGRPVVYLKSGVHYYWTVDSSVRIQVFDLTQDMPQLSQEELSLIPASDYLHAEVEAYQMGLLMLNGQLRGVLEPGRYRLWRSQDHSVRVAVMDMRRQLLAISGQELLTRDKVSLRVTVSVEYQVHDVAKVNSEVSDMEAFIYQASQLALREYVSEQSLDALLESRNELSEFLEQRVAPKLSAIGVYLLSIGVKDLILPGDMRAMLNRVILAEKEAAANVISRREETAATRALSNTARMMDEYPTIMRLKELDALRDVAERIQQLNVVVGTKGLGSLLPGSWQEMPGKTADRSNRET